MIERRMAGLVHLPSGDDYVMLQHYRCSSGVPDVADWRDTCSEHYGVNVVVAGSGVYTEFDRSSEKYEAGCCFHRLIGQRHGTRPARGSYEEYSLGLGPRVYAACFELGLIDIQQRVWQPRHAGNLVKAFQRACLCMPAASQQTSYDMSVTPTPKMDLRDHVITILQAARRAGEEDSEALVTIISQDLDTREYDGKKVHEICARHDGKYESVRKMFVQRYGMSLQQYRIRSRLNDACRLLINNSVKETAVHLGYSSPFAFSKQFSSYMGLSPSQYKRQAQ